jgi:hypothetical protein
MTTNILSKGEIAVEHAVLECTRCGIHLPLRRDLPADDPPAAWVCANCGWQMPGILDPTARDTILENVSPADSATLIDAEQSSRDTDPLLGRLLSEYLQLAK